MRMNIPAAKPSPRFAFGTLCWYAGDVFRVGLEIDLKDQDGERVHLKSGETVAVRFFDETHTLVKEFVPTISGDTVSLVFDKDTTALFGEGDYTYDVEYTYTDTDGARRTTLVQGNKCLVE